MIPHGLLFVSGGLALVYEILWIRQFTVLFGATTPATSATLAAVFFGWTTGSAVLGRYAARVKNPLFFYGLLEIVAAVTALAVGPIIGLYSQLYPPLFHRLFGSALVFALVKTLLVMAAVFLPCFCMGGTVPVVSQLFQNRQRHLGITGGGLYAANTLGGVVGALSVPFFWLPMFGADVSYRACVIIGLLLGSLACWLAGRWEGTAPERRSPTRPEPVPSTRRVRRPAFRFMQSLRGCLQRIGTLNLRTVGRVCPSAPPDSCTQNGALGQTRPTVRFMEVRAGHNPGESPQSLRTETPRALALMAGLSGALTFVLEVMWGRMFAQVHENSIYSFAVVLAVFLLGLGGGAILVRHLLARSWVAEDLLVFAWLSGGIAVLASPYLFFFLTNGLSYLQGGGWWTCGAQILWLCLPTVLLPVLLGGMVLPLLMELAGRQSGESSGRVLGWLLSINTAGSIAGALTAAFLLPALLGLWGSIVACGATMCFAGGWSLRACLRNRDRAASGPTSTSALVTRTTWTNRTNESERHSKRALDGAAVWIVCVMAVVAPVLLNPSRLPRTRISAEAGERLISLTEGSQGIVAVVEANGSRRIKLDNYYVLGGTASTGDERMQGHLPLLLHANPKRVAFLGLGTGITASAALFHPVEEITAMEIVPEVVRAAHDYLSEANLGVLSSPRVEVIVEDARVVLRSLERKFDVIVGDLVVPWRKGESALFTLEHFDSARRALAPGGIFCQWLPLFQLSEAEFDIAAATFLRVFPQTTVWRGDFAPDRPALALIGHADSAPLDPLVIARNVQRMRRDPANPHLAHEAGLWIYLIGALDSASPRFQQARLNREAHPWIELLGPLAHAGSSRGKRALFVGSQWEKFAEELRAFSIRSSPLSNLKSEAASWRDAGTAMAQATMLMAEGKSEGSLRMQQAVRRLPSEIQPAFLGR